MKVIIFLVCNKLLFKLFYFFLNFDLFLAWYEWPVMFRGVMYEWASLPDGKHSCIYLFGNPILFWIVLLGVCVSILYCDHIVYLYHFRPNANISPIIVGNVLLCLFGYFANYIPYPLLISRPCYMYHYHPALVFGIFLLGSLLDALSSKKKRLFDILYYLLIILITCSVMAAYFHFLPFSYNLPLTDEEHERRRWFHSFFKYW